MLDPVARKTLQVDWRPGRPKDVGVWQVLLKDPLFGSRLHTATFKGWSARGRDILMIGGCMDWNVPPIIAHRAIPSPYAEEITPKQAEPIV